MQSIRTSFAALAAALSISAIAQAQSGKQYNQTEQDLNQVQRDYYAIPYAMQLTILTDAAKAADKARSMSHQRRQRPSRRRWRMQRASMCC